MNREFVCVTGCNGYIGNHLVDLLLQQGYSVVGIDNLWIGSGALNVLKRKRHFRFISGDICKEVTWKMAFEYPIKYIINLAAIVGDPACLKNIRRSFEVNTIGAEMAAKMAKQYKVKKFLQASTCSIYGNQLGNLTEESAEVPVDFYGQTKRAAEILIKKTFKNEKKYVLARFGTAYGLSNRMRFDLVVNTFCKMAFQKKEITLFGGGVQKRPLTHCRDLARSLVHLLKEDCYGVYNIVGENRSIKDIPNSIKKIIDTNVINIKGMEDWRSYDVSNKKLKDTLFEFKFNINKGVKEIIEELQSGKIKNPDLEKYYNDKLGV